MPRAGLRSSPNPATEVFKTNCSACFWGCFAAQRGASPLTTIIPLGTTSAVITISLIATTSAVTKISPITLLTLLVLPALYQWAHRKEEGNG